MTCGTCEMTSHDIKSWEVIFHFALSALPSRCSCVVGSREETARDENLRARIAWVSGSPKVNFFADALIHLAVSALLHIVSVMMPTFLTWSCLSSHLAADFDLGLLQKWLALCMCSWRVCLLALKHFEIARKMLAKQGILGTFSCQWWRQYGQCLQCLCLVFAVAFNLSQFCFAFFPPCHGENMNEFASFSFSFLSVPHVEALFFLLGLAMQMFSNHSTASSTGGLWKRYAMVLRFGHHFNLIPESFSGRLFALGVYVFCWCRIRRCRRSARRAAWTMQFRRSFVRSWWAIKRVLVLWEFGISMVANFQ